MELKTYTVTLRGERVTLQPMSEAGRPDLLYLASLAAGQG
jgi:hypothetical protein